MRYSVIFSILLGVVCMLFIPASSDKFGVRCDHVIQKQTGGQQNTSKYQCVDCVFPDNCLTNGTCRLGTTGPMCEQCVIEEGNTNYYRVGSVCVSCPEVPWPAVCFSVYMAVFLGSIFFFGFTESLCTKVKLLIHYLQYLVLTVHVKVAWPDLLVRMVSSLSFGTFNSDILLPDCIFKQMKRMTVHYLQWYSSLLSPLLILVIGYLLDKSFKALISRQGKRTGEEASERKARKIDQRLKMRRFVILVILVMYMPALLSCMRTLQCSGTIMKDLTLDRSKDVFLLDNEYSCRTVIFQLTHSFAVLCMLALIVFTCLVLFFTLRQRKWELLDKDWMLYSPIYESYENKYCFWEFVPLLRKLMCIIVTETHPIKPLWQATIQLGMTTVYILLVLIIHPYRCCFWAIPRLNNHILFELSDEDEEEGTKASSRTQNYGCLKCWGNNKVGPDNRMTEKMQERKNNTDF